MVKTCRFCKFARNTSKPNQANQKDNKNMVNEIVETILNNTINSFDIPFCITTNIATYVIIKAIEDSKKCLTFTIWNKRLIFLAVSIVIALFYCLNGSDYKTILNSIVLAPVSWSWIFKPICARLGIDYGNKLCKD